MDGYDPRFDRSAFEKLQDTSSLQSAIWRVRAEKDGLYDEKTRLQAEIDELYNKMKSADPRIPGIRQQKQQWFNEIQRKRDERALIEDLIKAAKEQLQDLYQQLN